MRRCFGTPDYLLLASLLSAKIVSCSNNYEYVRNYQDCLTLVGPGGSLSLFQMKLPPIIHLFEVTAELREV
jgi:hypothetical protein